MIGLITLIIVYISSMCLFLKNFLMLSENNSKKERIKS